MNLSRRNFISGATGALALGLSACSNVHSGSGDKGSGAHETGTPGAKASIGKVTGTLTFAFWGGSNGETKGFTYVKEKFEAENPGAKVEFQVAPYDGFFSGIDRGLEAGNAPDLFRVDYTNIGKYSAKSSLLDLTEYFTKDETSAFLPAMWDAVQYNGIPYGVPHQTDVTAIIYDVDVFKAAGISSVPTKLEDAWTWDEFADVAKKLRAHLPAGKFPFAYDWTKAGAYRWFSWLYQSGGSIMNADHSKAALNSDAGKKALDFTRSFFTNKWVPDSNTIKGSKYSDDYFMSGIVPMTFVGDFLIPSIADPKTGYKGNWGVTFMPRDKGAATDLGGNAIVATKATKNPELAAAFLKFLVREDMMKYFCEQATELPTLKSLANSDLNYTVKPEAVKIFAKQATTLSETNTKEVSDPAFNRINTVLQDQLESAFTSQTPTSDVLSALESSINKELS